MNIPSLSQSPPRLSSHVPTSDSHRTDGKRMDSAIGDGASISSAPSKQDALALFERTLTLGYEKLQTKQDAVAPFVTFEPLSAEKVAGNVLGFIERRLQMDVIEGNTSDQLQSRLEAALAGFNKGFYEASEKLKALSMLSPEIEQDINKTYDLVLAGVDALREKFLRNLADAEPTSQSTESAYQQVYTGVSESSYQYASASSFSFVLLTADGDKVSITAKTSQAVSAQYSRAHLGADTVSALDASHSINRTAAWAIQGDINDDEMRAIENLLGQINKLAGEFFDGNLDEAFIQALALGYDQEHITAFSLNLTQVEVQRVSTAYKQFADSPSNSVGRLSESLLPLGKFVRDLLDALDSAKYFSEPQSLLLELSEKVVSEDERTTPSPAERFRGFVDQILSNVDGA